MRLLVFEMTVHPFYLIIHWKDEYSKIDNTEHCYSMTEQTKVEVEVENSFGRN